MKKLLRVNQTITFLSATLPPTLVSSFVEFTALPSLDIIRTAGTRPEICYAVVIWPKAELLQALVDYVTARIADYDPVDRMMIFCRTKSDVTAIASALNVQPYFSGLDSNDTVFQEWVSGISTIIVATPMLGTGTDYAHVRDAITFDLPYNMLDKYQQDCRCGRDGDPARALTFLPTTRKSLSHSPGEPDLGQSLLLSWALDNEKCRRLTPSLFLDGVALSCVSIPDAEYCDNCLNSASEKPPLQLVPFPINALQPLNTSQPPNAPQPTNRPQPVPRPQPLRPLLPSTATLDRSTPTHQFVDNF